VLDAKHGSHGRLLAHVSRANPVWRVQWKNPVGFSM
jgi:predicted FMN-binding regulatory protein PaiB